MLIMFYYFIWKTFNYTDRDRLFIIYNNNNKTVILHSIWLTLGSKEKEQLTSTVVTSWLTKTRIDAEYNVYNCSIIKVSFLMYTI